jgi:predicted RNase H-like HicB family nuclease
METTHYIPIKGEEMKTYIFKVVIEQGQDVWSAYCPTLLRQEGATWGHTREEAIDSINEVVRMVVQSLISHGEPVPDEPADEVQVANEPQVAVTI